MPNHDHFHELSALVAIGQLSLEEDRELNSHLRECEECRQVHNDYARVIVHELPLADAVRSRLRSNKHSPLPDLELRDRFFARARAEGLDFSAEAQRPARKESRVFVSRFRWSPALAFAGVALMAVLGAMLSQNYQIVSRSDMARTQSSAVALEQRNQDLLAQLAGVRDELSHDARVLGAIKHANVVSEESLRELERRFEDASGQVEQLSAQLQDFQARNSQLANNSRQKDAVISNLNAQNQKLTNDVAANLSARIMLESQIRNLRESLQQETANLDREQQFMGVSKDLRQLVSARNLHILDVHDVDGEGKSSKAFGRVFYAEGQELVFYAFDLPSGRLNPAKYTFEAWGQKEYVDRTVRNLGRFVVDDKEQRRWVLKVTDPKLLRGIDSIFVTAETPGAATSPRGRKLLYAYIVGEPNHP